MNRQWHIEAVDMKEEQVTDCNSFFTAAGMNHRVTFRTGDLTRLADEDKYDLILCIDVLEHITDDTLVMSNFARALKKNGVLIVSTPSDQGGSGVHDHHGESFIDEHVRNGYNITQLTGSLIRSGFSDVSAEYTYGWPGSLAWHLSMKYPISMLNRSSLFWLLLPFYYLPIMPFALILNTIDLLSRHGSGTGLIVKAIK